MNKCLKEVKRLNNENTGTDYYVVFEFQFLCKNHWKNIFLLNYKVKSQYAATKLEPFASAFAFSGSASFVNPNLV